MRVTSASTTVVSWALTCSDSTMRRAMTARSRDIFSVRPRTEVSGMAAGDGVRGGGADAAGAAEGGAGLSGAAGGACVRVRAPAPLAGTGLMGAPPGGRGRPDRRGAGDAPRGTSGVTWAPLLSPDGAAAGACGATCGAGAEVGEAAGWAPLAP